MLRKLLLTPLLALSLLASCKEAEPQEPVQQGNKVTILALNNYGSDGYAFEAYDHVRQAQAISFVFYPDQKSVDKVGRQSGIKVPKGGRLEAFSIWMGGSPSCQIHIVDPRIDYNPTALGHEMTHCIFGEFHPSRNPK